MTSAAKHIEDHDDGTVYECEVHFVKGTLEEREAASYYRGSNTSREEALKSLYKTMTLFVARSNVKGDKTYGTGTSAKLALTNLRMRQKKSMLKTLGI